MLSKMILMILWVLLTAFGCDVEHNDGTTGLNPGCNFAGVCVQITPDISTCVCCTPEKFGDNICGANWVCDQNSPSFQCFEFSSDDCSKVNQYLLVNLEFVTENVNEYQEPDIICNEWPSFFGQGGASMLSYDIADQVQSVASSKGWPGAIKSRGVCARCTSRVPCAVGDELITSGISFTFQVDLNLYYDLDCAVDFWIYGEVVECNANWDYGQSAWYIWRTVMRNESYLDDVNKLLQMDLDEDDGLGKGWRNTKIAAIREVLTVITNNNVILTAAPTPAPTAYPTVSPSASPTDSPTASPTDLPTASPTGSPTASPTDSPTAAPTESPTDNPTNVPSVPPTSKPSNAPTIYPTDRPSGLPTTDPTYTPTVDPTNQPTMVPTKSPTDRPTSRPTHQPTARPTRRPTRRPTARPTRRPIRPPTPRPVRPPTPRPVRPPTPRPTPAATPFYRYYHSGIMDHFYTRDWNELRWGSQNAWKYERTECKIHGSQVPGTVPLYRYWGSNDHFYTTNINEIGTARPGQRGKYNFVSEGVAGYCYPRPGRGLKPLYRFYHEGRHVNHFYKCSDRNTPGGYKYEGVQCYLPA